MRGKNGVVGGGRIGDGGEDACGFPAILILSLSLISILSAKGVGVLIFAVEFGRNGGMCFHRAVYDGGDDGGRSARLPCRCCRLRDASFVVCGAVRPRLCVCVSVVRSGGHPRGGLHLADVSCWNGHLGPSAHYCPDAFAGDWLGHCH